ncbi:MAG: hypothetical protein NZL85_05325 [Fimbriimonadales bacterium]|nr:hypothetical protein [Fimbriimonadales bacterium]
MRGTSWVLGWIGWGLLMAQAQPSLPPVQARTQFDLGWSDWGLRGNPAQFRQYATPPRGFFLHALRYELSTTRLLWQGGGDQDTRGDAFTHLLQGRLMLEAHHARSQFTDPGAVPAPESERRSEEATLRYLLTPDSALTVRFRDDTLRRPFASAHVPYNQTAQAWDMLAEGVVGAGRLSLQSTRWRYRDRTDTRPDLTLQRWQAGYLWEPTPALGLEAVWAEARFEQAQRPVSRVQSLTLFTDWMPSAATEIGLMLQRERLNLPVVRNAWTRERRTGALSLAQQFGAWRLQIGVRRHAIERWNREQSLLEPIQREGIEARLSGRLSRQTRLTLYSMSQHWSRQASGEPRTTLFWSRREIARLNLDSGLPNGYLYLTLSRQRWLNEPRATRLRSDQLLVGGVYQLRSGLTLMGEHRVERWKASGGADGLIGLSRFLPDTRSSVVGLQWASGVRLSASLLFTHFVISTDNPLLLPDGNTEGWFLTLSLRYRLPNGSAWSFTVAPWRYRDRVDSRFDYRLSLFSIGWSTPF